jgi:hypothetical protein
VDRILHLNNGLVQWTASMHSHSIARPALSSDGEAMDKWVRLEEAEN